jgi:hypothetical protein
VPQPMKPLLQDDLQIQYRLAKDDLLNESERHYRHHQINAHYLYSEGRSHLKIRQIENL